MGVLGFGRVLSKYWAANNRNLIKLYQMSNGDFETAGEGSPTIVLIGSQPAWQPVWSRLSEISHVVRYDDGSIEDRLRIESPYSFEAIERDFWNLISANCIKLPFVLVGHSIGGLIVQYLSRRNTGKICGVVLIDSVHPMQRSQFFSFSKEAGTDLQQEITQWLGYLDYERVEAEMREAPPLESQMPLLVISRGIEAGLDVGAVWKKLQTELAAQSQNVRHVTVAKSRHAIQFDAPEVIVEEISRFVMGLR